MNRTYIRATRRSILCGRVATREQRVPARAALFYLQQRVVINGDKTVVFDD